MSAHLALHLPPWEGCGEGERRHEPTRDRLKPNLPPSLSLTHRQRCLQTEEVLARFLEAGFAVTATRSAGEGG